MRRPFHTIATIVVIGALSAAGCAKREGEEANQQTFATPDEATAAFVSALEKHDPAEMRRLLGLGSDALLSSGDTAEDRTDREAFLARYNVRHRLVAGGPDDLILQVGEDDWPLPVPLLRRDGRWRFDGEAAVNELRARRIGANELRTIDVMRSFVAAQDEYAGQGHDGAPPGVYARVLRSEPGRQNGLYWEVSAGEAPSPAGPLLAAAATEGRRTSDGASGAAPYHGYVYRMLFSQGAAADGGALDYTVDGKLTRGFALLARPAEYGKTGVMTFMVSNEGVVWQRDLGPQTTELAAAIAQFNPDSTWTPVPADEETQPLR